MDSATSKAVEACRQVIKFAFDLHAGCHNCPAREHCKDREDPLNLDCQTKAMRWLALEVGIPYAVNCEDNNETH